MTENKYKITRFLVFGSSLRFGVKYDVLGRCWMTRGKDAVGSWVFFVLSSPSSGLSVSRRARLRARRNIRGEHIPCPLRPLLSAISQHNAHDGKRSKKLGRDVRICLVHGERVPRR